MTNAALVEANLGLVKKIANRYQGIAASRKIEFDDLVQWGSMELMTCLRTFDPQRMTVSFSTYAYKNIRRTLLKKINQVRYTKHATIEFNDKLVEPHVIDYDKDFMVSEALTYAYSAVDSDLQWAALTAFLEDVPIAEVARELGCTPQNLNFALQTVFKKAKMLAEGDLNG